MTYMAGQGRSVLEMNISRVVSGPLHSRLPLSPLFFSSRAPSLPWFWYSEHTDAVYIKNNVSTRREDNLLAL
jgi:hypothetical protein